MDKTLIEEMQKALLSFKRQESTLGRLADRLLELRDALEFRDKEWFHAFTQYVATLDSAATFSPRGSDEAAKKDSAVTEAIAGIQKLLDSKSD